MAANQDLIIRLDVNTNQLRASLSQAEREVNQSAGRMRKDIGKLSRTFSALSSAGGGLTDGMKLADLARQFYEVNKSFQELQASLTAVMGSTEAASTAFASIREFAKDIPYDVQEVTKAFIQLKTLGLDASQEAMRAYGDLAAATPGKSMADAVAAVGDASMGQFKGLRAFGIQASSEGDRVRVTFQGVTREIGKGTEEIERYLAGLAQANFGGAMAEQMETLGGKASALKGAIDELYVAIGEAGAVDALAATLDVLTASVEGITNNLGLIGDVMATVTAVAVGRMAPGMLASAGAMVTATAESIRCQIGLMKMAGAAQTAGRLGSLALASVGGPLGLAITATAGAIYLLSTRQTEAEAAAEAAAQSEKTFKDALADMGSEAETATGKLEKLTGARADLARSAANETIEKERDSIASSQRSLRSLVSMSEFSSRGFDDINKELRNLLKQDYIDEALARDVISRLPSMTEDNLQKLLKDVNEAVVAIQNSRENIERQKKYLAILNGETPPPKSDPPKSDPSKPGKGTPLSCPGSDSALGSDGDEQKNRIETAIERLRFERKQLISTDRERYINNALHEAGIEGTDGKKAEDLRNEAGKTFDQQHHNDLVREGEELTKALFTAQEKYNAEMERLDELKGAKAIDDETYARAATRAAEDLAKAQSKVSATAQEMGNAIAQSFERAVLEGGNLRDVMNGLLQDILAIAMRKAITEPLGEAIGLGLDMLPSLFADGGIMTGQGPVPLRTYSGGGIARRAQVAVFGEGSVPEAFVPVPSGRIPVELRGLALGNGGGGGGTVVQVIDQRRGGAPVKTERGRTADGRDLVRLVLGEVSKDIANNGPVGRTIQTTFGATRQGVSR